MDIINHINDIYNIPHNYPSLVYCMLINKDIIINLSNLRVDNNNKGELYIKCDIHTIDIVKRIIEIFQLNDITTIELDVKKIPIIDITIELHNDKSIIIFHQIKLYSKMSMNIYGNICETNGNIDTFHETYSSHHCNEKTKSIIATHYINLLDN